MVTQQQYRNSRTLIALALMLSFLLIVALWLKLNQPQSGVLGVTASADVQINAIVPSCLLGITVYPEKRIPPVNNWGTILTVNIYDSTNSLFGTFTTTTNSQGQSLTDLCALGMTPLPGTYTFYLRGYSHLRKVFPSIDSFENHETDIDFSSGGEVLLAGETSNIFDNKINSLDLSTQIVKLYTSDYKNDLNQDGKVNSLDISNTIYNFFKTGD